MGDDTDAVSTDTVSFVIVAGSLVQASKAIRDALEEGGFEVSRECAVVVTFCGMA